MNSSSNSQSSSEEVIARLADIAGDFAKETIDRQRRRELDPADFTRIREAGFLLTGVPADQGGLWQGYAKSARAYATMVRTLAHGDPSVALVAAMHPAVLAFFLGVPDVEDAPAAWASQRQSVIDLARDEWWGTITSEPGSGGDILKTKSMAVPAPNQTSAYRCLLTGDKHFGSGAGHARYMITTGRFADSKLPELFYLELKDKPWDGSQGCQLLVPWDGIGMSATQSHAFRFNEFPVIKAASSEVLPKVTKVTTIMSNLLFTGVILGVADNAMAFARSKIAGREQSLRAFEATEWTRCGNELWLAEQAYQGALMAAESESGQAQTAAVRCKITVAELVETALARMSKVVGGASFSKAMPLAQWTQDVKALGFLRPPLPLAYDQLLLLASQSGE